MAMLDRLRDQHSSGPLLQWHGERWTRQVEAGSARARRVTCDHCRVRARNNHRVEARGCKHLRMARWHRHNTCERFVGDLLGNCNGDCSSSGCKTCNWPFCCCAKAHSLWESTNSLALKDSVAQTHRVQAQGTRAHPSLFFLSLVPYLQTVRGKQLPFISYRTSNWPHSWCFP